MDLLITFVPLLILMLFWIGVPLLVLRLIKGPMSKAWQFDHNGNNIHIIKNWTRVSLFVNDKLQDENNGLFVISSNLLGRLPTGEELKVSIGSGVGFRCNVFVDQSLIFKG